MRISDWSSDVCSSDLWQVADGDWLLPGNWSAGLPGLVDTARIDNAGIVRIAAAGAQTQALIVGDSNSGFVEVAEGGTLDVGSGAGTIELARLARSEEHTSELQSLMRISYAVFCLTKQNKTVQQ